jgi:hypothetical protein
MCSESSTPLRDRHVAIVLLVDVERARSGKVTASPVSYDRGERTTSSPPPIDHAV